MVIGFAGMTHLGINSLVATAERGFKVLGFDPDLKLINQLEQGDPLVVEPQLPELMASNSEKISFSCNAQGLSQCDLVYIAADVPTDNTGSSDLTPIRQLIEKVIPNLNLNAILVILCQVPPGFTRELPFPKDRLYYQVETLIFGKAIERALYPERFIIGCADPKCAEPEAFRVLLEAFKCPILKMRYESAELAKISINFCLVSSISVANTLSEVCEKLGADWSEIVPALKLDKRIGQFSYLSPGLGIAGGNLERDLTTVLELSHQYGTDTSVVSAWIKNSKHRRDWVLRVLHKKLLSRKKDAVIAVLGLAYKENTHSTKNSPSLALIESLTSYHIKVYDPIVAAVVAPNSEGCSSVEDTIIEADVLVIMTPWAEFKNLALATLEKMKGRLIIDPYQVLNGSLLKSYGFQYATLGVSVSC